MGRRLYTIREACATLGLSRTTVYGLIRRGQLRTEHPTGRQSVRISRAEICRVAGLRCAECRMRDVCGG